MFLCCKGSSKAFGVTVHIVADGFCRILTVFGSRAKVRKSIGTSCSRPHMKAIPMPCRAKKEAEISGLWARAHVDERVCAIH